jgi:integrase
VRVADGAGSHWTIGFAVADDHEDADGTHVLDFWQAQDRARDLARGRDADAGRPATLAEALDDYERNLAATGREVANATRLRHHLPPALLSKPVALLAARELQRWRVDLVAGGLKPATATRTAKILRACLNTAADHDSRISDRSAWRVGLAGLTDTYNHKHVPYSDQQVRAVVAAAYALNPAFGLYVELHAVTGARSSQLAGLEVADLDDGAAPRLLMPSSRKGRGRRQVERKPVPISPALAAKLRLAAGDRAATDQLLLRPDGKPWSRSDHSELYAEAAKAAGVPGSIYSLRHTAITRALVARIPIRVVAAWADTSVTMLEKTYSAYILDHSDALLRSQLFDANVAPVPDNVTVLPRGRRP